MSVGGPWSEPDSEAGAEERVWGLGGAPPRWDGGLSCGSIVGSEGGEVAWG